MLALDEALIERASFLDTRLEAPLAQASALPVADVARASVAQAPVAWLFHTSFCASTLLARALHLAPNTVCLKEPLVLRRLADARKSGWPLDGLVDTSVKLLGRPWHPGGAVVIKPTHVALNVAQALLAATPHSRAIVLTSSLDDFMVSNIKKEPASQAKIPTLVDRALRATTFRARLPAIALEPPDLIAASGLQWAAQRELVADVVDAVGASRIRVLDMHAMLRDFAACVVRCADWLELAIPHHGLARHAADTITRNAKALDVSYGAEQRARDASAIAGQFRPALGRARAWLDRHVLPAMRPIARDEPSAW